MIFFLKIVVDMWKQMNVNQMIYLMITKHQNVPISKFRSLQSKLVGWTNADKVKLTFN